MSPSSPAAAVAATTCAGACEALPAQALVARLGLCRRSPALAAFLPAGLRAAGGGPGSAEGENSAVNFAEPPSSEGSSEGLSEGCGEGGGEAQAARGRGEKEDIWHLAFDPRGCRELQRRLLSRTSLAQGLRGRVADAVRSPHANHVVQKCVEVLLPEEFQFVIEELMGDGLQHAARHKFGCRVVQRLLEHGLPGQVREMVEALMPSISALARHAYGNYVVQCMLGHCAGEQHQRVMGILKKDIALVCKDHYGSSVVRAVLASGTGSESAAALAEAVIKSQGLVQELSRSRHGHMIIKLVVNLLEVSERMTLTEDLADTEGLTSSRYGRTVLQRLGLHSSKKLAICAVHAGA